MTPIRMRRGAALAALAGLVMAGLATRALPGSAFADIAGDALYAVAVYAGLVLLAPRARPLLPAAVAAAWCLAVELLQLTGAPLAVAAVFPPAALVLGSGFDPRDLVVYAGAATAAALIDAAVRSRGGMRPASAPLERT